MRISLQHLRWLAPLVLWWLIYWGSSGEARLGMDGMTYGALAKHILSTGDWKTLHYARQAYADFYQHPPLMLWSTALIFKFFGATEITVRILPSLFALGTLAAVMLWGRIAGTVWQGTLAALVLLTSTRFVKYGSTLMLDGPLAFWLTCGALLLVLLIKHPKGKNIGYSVGIGLCMAAALLTKGMPALVLPFMFGVCVIRSAFLHDGTFRRLGMAFVISFFVASAILGTWLLYAGGLHFVSQYWQQSVSNRIGGAKPSEHFAPIGNLLKVYWPWLPIFAWGIFATVKGILEPIGIAASLALLIILGFMATGHFLEQYLVPFYPFAAVVVSAPLANWVARAEKGILSTLMIIALLYGLILAALPVHVRGEEYHNPIRVILKRAALECRVPEISRILISDRVTALWWGLAAGLWNTPWDAAVIQVPQNLSPDIKNNLLLAHRNENIPNWEKTTIIEGDLAIFQPQKSALCSY